MIMKKITRKSNIYEVVLNHPEVAEVFMGCGLHCVGCPLAGSDTIEGGAKMHGMGEREIDALVGRINEVVEHSE